MALDPSKLLAGDASGLIWVVIVIATIIAQIMKAAKKGPPQTPGTPGRPLSQGEGPEQELQDFLRNLTQGMEMPSTPSVTPPPMPPPLRPHAVAARPAAAQRQAPPAIRSAPQKRAPAPVVVEAPAMPTDAELMRRAAQAVRDAEPSDAAPSRARAATRTMALLRGRDSLRSAVVLREILGPPLGWRLSAGPGTTGGRA